MGFMASHTIAATPSAGVDPEGAGETHTGKNLVVENEKMHGFHGHLWSDNEMLFFQWRTVGVLYSAGFDQIGSDSPNPIC
jgi:hypothetical protein